MDDKDNHQKWELEIQVLEDKIDSLVKCCLKLHDENHTLKNKQGELVRDRAQLLEKTTIAKTRVESIIARLKSVEHEG